MNNTMENYKLNLQLFAEDTGDNEGGEEKVVDPVEPTNEDNKEEQKKDKPEKTIEELLEEKQKEWQSETDRRVNQALEKLKKEQEEKERLSKLTEEEKIKELEKQKAKELDEYKNKLEIRETKLTIKDKLQEAGLLEAEMLFKPETYINNEEALVKDIEALNLFISTEVEKKVEEVKKEYLTGKTPKNPENKRTGLTKEDFNKMGLVERTKLFNDNPELYRSLSK